MNARTRSKVLIVDDSPTNLGVAVELLKAYSYRILIARDGATGLERARLGQPDVVLLDVQMPGLDGYETCRRIKANPETADIPVLFMTGLATVEDRLRAFDAGAVDFVLKPIEERELLARVRVHTELRRLKIELQARATELQAAMAEQSERAESGRLAQESRDLENESLRELVRQQSVQIADLTRELMNGVSDPGDSATDSALLHILRTHLSTTRAHTQLDVPARELAALMDRRLGVSLELVDRLAAWQPTNGAAKQASPLLGLSDREREIVALMVDGLSNKEIAFELNVARTTVSTHRKRILDKLGIDGLPALVKLALHHESGP